MEEQPITHDASTHQPHNNKKTLYLIGIVLVLLGIGFVGGFLVKDMTTMKDNTATPVKFTSETPVTVFPTPIVKVITTQQPTPSGFFDILSPLTKIATSLSVPDLPKSTTWTKATTLATSDLSTLVYTDPTKLHTGFYPLTGHFYSGNVPYTASDGPVYVVVKHYSDSLVAENWGGFNASDGGLQFQKFNLEASGATGVTGDETGFIGYKDGMVRVVNISEGWPFTNGHVVPTEQQIVTAVVFVSDPVPLQDITSYITSHPPK